MASSTAGVTKLFWNQAKRYSGQMFVIVMGVALAEAIGSVATPIYIKKFFDILTQNSPSLSAANQARAVLWVLVAFWFSGWFLWRMVGIVTTIFQTRIMTDLQDVSFQYLIRHSFQFFSDTFAGSLVKKVNRLSNAFEEVADNIQFGIIPFFIALFGALFVIFSRSHLIGAAFFLWILTFIIFNVVYSRWKVKFDVIRSELESSATGVLSDSLSNALNIRLFSAYTEEEAYFRSKLEGVRKARVRSWGMSELSSTVQYFLSLVVQSVVFYVSIRSWQEGRLTVGDFVLFQSYFILLLGKVRDSERIIRRIYGSYADAKEMVDILEIPHEIRDIRSAKNLRITKGEIVFEGVNFSYQKTRPMLKNFDLKINAGEKVGIVGPSGAGKSTIVKLLFRLYDIQKGKIRIDGQVIARVTQQSLHEQISLVPQEPLLFHRTLMENIRYGRRDATDEEVIEAARRAHCHEFIQKLPLGYETFVGERGVKLSGGERQRVAIARAILKNAPILVLDEATSSLDSESEALIQEALQELMQEKTVIAIAHRLSTIMQMDRIIVIDGGKVADSGTHARLLTREGIYQKLWNIQASGFTEENA